MADKLKLTICQGPTCAIMGGEDLQRWCTDLQQAGVALVWEVGGCTGHCTQAPVIEWGDDLETEATPEMLTERLIRENRLL